MTRLDRLLRLLVILCLPLAGIGAGLGYRLPLELRDPGLATWLAMGGKASGLCGGSDPGDLHGHCDACRLAGPAALPVPDPGCGRTVQPRPLRTTGKPPPVADASAPRRAAPPRGPPALA